MMKNLPIGLQEFADFSKRNCVYVDKTEYIFKLMNAGGKSFFLSRPRRFGKSLLLTTIQAIFEGRKELFEDLYIYDKIDWQQHPVVLLDMSQNAETVAILKTSLTATLKRIASQHNIEITYDEPSIILSELIINLYKKNGQQVVLLIDEYDKPILDAMANLERATEIRAFLQVFYTVVKSLASSLRFIMLTGVSKISQTSIFSGLNNLKDITFDNKYAGICGYSQNELESGFSGYIKQVADKYEISYADMLAKIKRWYNGYSWNGEIFVYNPFSALLLFEEQVFAAHWFNTGTPTFLINLLKNQNDFSPVLEQEIVVDKGFADSQTLERLSLVPLCFQTGYLTIKKYDFKTGTYWLGIPNEEVREAFTKAILVNYTNQNGYEITTLAKKIKENFAKGDTAVAISCIRTLFAQISYNTHQPSESHYHALFQLAMNLTGVQQQAESYTNKGRTDSVLTFNNRVYVIEMKYANSPEILQEKLTEAEAQINEKSYYEPYLHQQLEVHAMALVFTKGDMAFREMVL